jgi:light-harvesting complex 1 beta chain
MTDDKGSVSGLSEAAAKAFHAQFITSFVIFTAIAIVAHILAWIWRPWLVPLPTTGMIDAAQSAVVTMLS